MVGRPVGRGGGGGGAGQKGRDKRGRTKGEGQKGKVGGKDNKHRPTFSSATLLLFITQILSGDKARQDAYCRRTFIQLATTE